MNERILELAEQAGLLHEPDGDGDVYLLEHATGELEKFAELIVEECAQDFDKTYMSGGETVGTYIRQKFGIAK